MAALYGRDIHRFKGALYQIALSSRIHLIVCDDRNPDSIPLTLL
jgi:hypothetical protein